MPKTDCSPTDPRRSALHRIRREHLATFLAEAELPGFVVKELRSYLDCGTFGLGCAHYRCADCGDDRVAALSCQGRGSALLSVADDLDRGRRRFEAVSSGCAVVRLTRPPGLRSLWLRGLMPGNRRGHCSRSLYLLAVLASACGIPMSTEELAAVAPIGDDTVAARLDAERATAAADSSHAPRLVDGRPRLGAAAAQFTPSGAAIDLGTHELSLRVSAIGRGAREPLPAAEPTIVGPEVRFVRAAGVVEWWRSLPRGLEHGVTLEVRPSGEGTLAIEVAVGGLAPRLDSPGTVEFLDARGSRVATYAELVVVDAGGSEVPASMAVEDGCIVLRVDDAGARYPLVVDPILVAEEATLLAFDRATGDSLGESVALDATATRALVGADADAPAGSARVFLRSGSTWTEEATLLNGGTALSLSADAALALVGSTNGARVFARAGTTWALEASLTAAMVEPDAYFGAALALSADGTRAIVGAYGDDDLASSEIDVGSAHLYRRTGTTWTSEATLTGTTQNDNFGRAVALSADGSRALVTEPGAFGGGRARVFTRSGTAWGEEAVLAMGVSSVSVSLSADGSRALIGAPFDATSTGSARVFVRSGTVWMQEVMLTAPGGAAFDRFGWSVALSAGADLALVGAYADDTTGGVDSGSAHLFSRTGTAWVSEAIALPSGGAANDWFGWSVAIAADGSRGLVGAPSDDSTVVDGGSARVYTLLRTNGLACSVAAQCASGNCVDGVCCDTACGGGSASDCQACSTALTGGAAGACAPLSASVAPTVVCRTPMGPCDVEDRCVSTSTACTDGFSPSTTVCRASTNTCDATELCTGSSALCPTDGATSAGTVCRASAGTCDATEACDGTSPACPADGRVPAGVLCRGSAGSCDVAESCDGTSPTCPTDAFHPATMVCRMAAGTCDATDFCSGSSAACPDGFLSGTVCRASVGPCDVAESCDGSGTACPNDAVAASGTMCAAASGACDAPDFCNGSTSNCPASYLTGGVCRPSAGVCDVEETCPGSGPTCPADGFQTGVVCRGSSGPCDLPDSCSGSSAACPTDAVRPAGTVCAASSGSVCDRDDTCDGVTVACAPRFEPTTTTCRTAVGECDVAETCSGTSATCPTDVFQPPSRSCGPAPSGVCDATDYCAGTSAACVPTFAPGGTTCRAASGPCDVDEECTGASTSCPTNLFLSAGITCRPGLGPCDVAEVCTGTAASCPFDAFADSTVVCRVSAGICDLPEECTGASAGCPANALAPPGAVCRAAASVCDVAETCSGIASTCPADAFGAAGITCRAASGACDVADTCTGLSGTCPADTVALTGTICRGTTGACDPDERCDGSATACPADLRSPAGTACGGAATGSCSSPGVCDGSAAACPGATPRPAGTVCLPADPGNPCDVDDTCDGVSDGCGARFSSATTACGAAPSGACDAPDHCAGTSGDCVATFLAGTECRASTGACDLAEVCAGASAACPPDALVPSGVVCRAATGPCDLDEVCGGSAACPADALHAAGTSCRTSAGGCDVADVCDGSTATCADVFSSAGTICRPAVAECDVAELCSGASVDCPLDGYRAATETCGLAPSDLCDAPDRCDGASASCVETFLSGVECRAAAGGCDLVEVCLGDAPSCPPDGLLSAGSVCRASTDASCDPAEACDGTASACPADVSTCAPIDGGVPDAGDAGRPADGGSDAGATGDGAPPDAAAPPVAAAGCACRAGARFTGGSPLGLSLVVLFAVGASRLAQRRPQVRAARRKHSSPVPSMHRA